MQLKQDWKGGKREQNKMELRTKLLYYCFCIVIIFTSGFSAYDKKKIIESYKRTHKTR